jgi:hypothetical protein
MEQLLEQHEKRSVVVVAKANELGAEVWPNTGVAR